MAARLTTTGLACDVIRKSGGCRFDPCGGHFLTIAAEQRSGRVVSTYIGKFVAPRAHESVDLKIEEFQMSV